MRNEKVETEKCSHCDRTGWVCEEHPDKPMMHDGCLGAGKRCEACVEAMKEAA